MSVEINEVPGYKQWGKCVRIANDFIEALVSVEFGPRILYLGIPGDDENVFFNDDNNALVTKSKAFEAVFGEGSEFRFYGGHRLWLAPQYIIHTCYPDNDPVVWEVKDNTVSFTPPPQRVNEMQVCMTVGIAEDKAEITIECKYTNVGHEQKEYACWQISQLAPGGLAILPFLPEQHRRQPGNPEGRHTFDLNKPLIPYGELSVYAGTLLDNRLGIGPKNLSIRQDPNSAEAFKIGLANHQGWMMYANGSKLVTIKQTHIKDGRYLSGFCSCQCFTDANFLELECLGELVNLKPGQSMVHSESILLSNIVGQIPDYKDPSAVEAFVEMNMPR